MALSSISSLPHYLLPFTRPHKTLNTKPYPLKFPPLVCLAAKQQSGSVKSNKKRRKKDKPITKDLNFDGFDERNDGGGVGVGDGYVPLPLPKPPAGFVVDQHGSVVLVSSKRIVTIVDPTNNLPLECMIRRVFTNSKGDDCMLLCPVDMPIQILKSTNVEGWSAVSDDEIESILPTAAYALAKIHMHLVHSGFCYTARGGFCYSEDSIFEFRSDDGQGIDGVPAEGVDITCFHMNGSHYMIYTPSDPLLFVAVKDENGEWQIADDDLLDDPAVVSAIDEETEFNALVEEEAALLESMLVEDDLPLISDKSH